MCDGNDSGGDVESIDEDVVRFVGSVLIFVFVHGDSVTAYESAGSWWFGDRIVDDTPVAVFAQNSQSFRVWVLAVFEQPESSVAIEGGLQGLSDQWFAQEQIPFQVVVDLKCFLREGGFDGRFVGGVFGSLRKGQRCAAEPGEESEGQTHDSGELIVDGGE